MSGSVFSRSSLEHATAGSAGTVLSTLLLFPLDRLKTLLQVETDLGVSASDVFLIVLREEGIRGLFKGCPVMLQTVGVSNFLYFFLFEGLKDRLANLLDRDDGVVGPYETLVASAVAGVLNMAVTEPLWRASVVAQAQNRKFSKQVRAVATSSSSSTAAAPALVASSGVFTTVYTMWKEEGPIALWRGVSSSMWLVSNPVIQFFVYDLLKAMRSDAMADVSSLEALSMGAVAKALATVATFPLQVAQSRLRVAGNGSSSSSPELRGMVACLRSIVKERGFSGLYFGLAPKLLQTVTTAAFMFAFYEKIHWLIRRLSRKGVQRLARRMRRWWWLKNASLAREQRVWR